MMLQMDWKYERNRLLFCLVIVALISMVVGYTAELIALFLFTYTVWQFYRLQALFDWAKESDDKEPPFSEGLYGQLAESISLSKNQHLEGRETAAEQLARFRELMENFPDGVVILSINNEIEWFNDRASALLVLKIADKGKQIHHLLRGPKFYGLLNSKDSSVAIITEAPRIEANLLVEKLEVRLLPYGKDERVLFIRDVTKVERANQMRRDLAANISHELRTPLTVLKGYVEMLLADTDADKERVEKSLLKVDQQVLKMQAMIESMLQISKLENAGVDNSNATTDMATIFETLDAELAPLIEKSQQQLSFNVDRNSNLNANESSLLMVLRNLISNAIHYSGQHGDIWVSWGVNDEGEGIFTVKDSGKGIPSKHLARLTERFYRVPENNIMHKAGTGLGLAIVKHELERYEAKLVIDSKVGKGSRFQCVFPAKRVIARIPT